MKFTRWFKITSFIIALTAVSALAYSQIAISINIAPPPLPIYDQPPCPAPNLIWTPGYWAWGDDGYYWVPGTWVEAPAIGLLWTPGYWTWENGGYLWNEGYWAPEVGFYGGIDYGYGYPGEGYYGGRWMGNTFAYNVAVVNINTTVIRHTYRNQVNYRNQFGRVSFNGGRGGIQARPTAAQQTVRQHRRYGPIQAQTRQASLARTLRQNYARVNNGHPEHAAMPRPARSASDFSRAVPARNARPGDRPNNNARPNNGRPNNNNVRPTPVTPTRPNARPEATPRVQPPQPEYRNTRPGAPPNAQPTPPGYRTTQPEARPNARPEPPQNRNTQPAPRQEPRPQPHNNVRPAIPNSGVQPQGRPQTRPESRPQPQQRQEQRPEARPQQRQEQQREARPQNHEQQHSNPGENPHRKEPKGI